MPSDSSEWIFIRGSDDLIVIADGKEYAPEDMPESCRRWMEQGD